jgi:hypothetical protein
MRPLDAVMLDPSQDTTIWTRGTLTMKKRPVSCYTLRIPAIGTASALEAALVSAARRKTVAASTAAPSRTPLEKAFGMKAFDERMPAFATIFDLWPLRRSEQPPDFP